MRLLVLSDSHGSLSPMLAAAAAEPKAAACFFLGDGTRELPQLAAALPALPLCAVRGNSDFSPSEPDEALASFGGLLFYCTHGHLLGVKQDLNRLWHAAARRGADVALYGHTHAPYYEYRDGIHLFCPGALTRPRRGAPSYGTVTVRNGAPAFEWGGCR